MATDWVLYLRAVQLIFAIIELGLTAYGKFRPSCIQTPLSSPTFKCAPFFF